MRRPVIVGNHGDLPHVTHSRVERGEWCQRRGPYRPNPDWAAVIIVEPIPDTPPLAVGAGPPAQRRRPRRRPGLTHPLG